MLNTVLWVWLCIVGLGSWLMAIWQLAVMGGEAFTKNAYTQGFIKMAAAAGLLMSLPLFLALVVK